MVALSLVVILIGLILMSHAIRREMEDRYIEGLNELGAWKLRHGAFDEALTLFKALDAVDSFSEAAAAKPKWETCAPVASPRLPLYTNPIQPKEACLAHIVEISDVRRQT